MRDDVLNTVLVDLNGASADIEACAVLSTDGLMIASQLPQGLDPDRVGAMGAAMLSLGDRTAAELSRGQLNQVMIDGGNGYVLMSHAGEDAVLAVLATKQAKLGLIFLDVKRAAEKIAQVLAPTPAI